MAERTMTEVTAEKELPKATVTKEPLTSPARVAEKAVTPAGQIEQPVSSFTGNIPDTAKVLMVAKNQLGGDDEPEKIQEKSPVPGYTPEEVSNMLL